MGNLMIKKKWIIYMLRWQASSLVLAPVIYLISNNPILAAIIGNAIGGILFYQIDHLIFNYKKHKEGDKN